MNEYQKKLNEIYEEKMSKVSKEDREEGFFVDKILGDSIREAQAATNK